VAILSGGQVPFSEVSAHRATLEEAYMELTRDAVEFRAAGPGGRPPGSAEPAASPDGTEEVAK
jgi:ABC-2 type transport system ATP-binding protein